MDVDPDTLVERSEEAIQYVEIFAAYVLVALFAVGVFDLLLTIAGLVRTGRITDPNAVVDLIDTVLLLFIIVEVYQTAVAYSRERSVVRVVVVAGIIAISRKVITFRPDQAASKADALMEAGALAVLLLVLVGALYLIRTTPNTETIE
jgi:uncharacterized membrane protein (DUF373 family)